MITDSDVGRLYIKGDVSKGSFQNKLAIKSHLETGVVAF
jgi:hypothetical protein